MGASEIDRAKVRDAAIALGLDPTTLSFDSAATEPEPEPLPELKIEQVSAEEWEVLEPALLRHSRYLSKVPPRDFINAALWLATFRFDYALLPVPSEWSAAAVRDKIARMSRTGLWHSLLDTAAKSRKFSEERLRLLDRLVAYEDAAQARSERLRALRQKELASGTVARRGRHFA
jgi:hypothetical protein